MEQIIIGCTYSSEMFYRLRRDIDYLRETSIDFKVNLAHREIMFPELNKSIIYTFESSNTFKYFGKNILNSRNYSIKEIIESSDNNE